MKNALTFDVEDYFQVGAFADLVQVADWSGYSGRLAENMEKILTMLDQHNCVATFFVLGWVAENQPQIVSRIAAGGHEIACHSHHHRRVFEMTPAEFREDTRRAKESLENVCGQPVRGYRAPSFSITQDSLWAFEILAELGFTYDSSIFPVEHPNYGMPKGNRAPFLVNTPNGPIVEFPMSTLEIAGRRAPLGGGAYLRLLPYWYTRWGLRYLNRNEGRSACVYVHPWEIDPEQPRIARSGTARLRHSLGLPGLEAKLRHLLRDFDFCPLGLLVDGLRELEPAFPVSG
jgi:polysaccharide deacetylase family protein (PEP-CTERM system associated)